MKKLVVQNTNAQGNGITINNSQCPTPFQTRLCQIAYRAGALLRRSRIPTILKYAGGIALVGAGARVGLMFPDWDIKLLGIGGHRNFLFHSALPIWGAHWARKTIVKKYPARPGSIRELCYKGAGLFIAGAALGAAIHLFIDVAIQGSKAVIFPLIGSPIRGTLLDDHLWLGGNSLISLYIAYREFEYCLGKNHWMLRKIKPHLGPYLEKARRKTDAALGVAKKARKFLLREVDATWEAIKEADFLERLKRPSSLLQASRKG